LLVRPSQSLDEDLWLETCGTIDADGDLMAFENGSKGFAGELRALISVEYSQTPVMAGGLLKDFVSEVGIHDIGDPQREDPGALPVNDSHQIQKPTAYGNVPEISPTQLV